ncbi:membrane protein [Streptococcus equi subsp. zooepidemicus Sz35]|uniref:hypothetical protein n=1 Tax=Streptococcus equi TaxID=1336 RepID=UPI0005C2FED3|nr:hypothetical protein [Streptococcus equi]KIS21063.1 membrane protein [Streptococcus equi subsp. zooepidemicus Sz35]
MPSVSKQRRRDQARFEAVAAADRASQGWVDLALSLVTIAVGVAAIVMTAGAATPLVVGACVVGSCTVAYGVSNLYEAGHNIYLGSVGDGVTVASNPLRDTLFMGNDKLYHQVGGLFTTASAALIPIGQTKSVAKGLTEFTIGEVGGFIGGQASYHGTKLLGGSDQDAQRATLVGNILGGYAASSAARRFSLNEPIAARVTKPTYSRQQLLKNLENSRLARQSSRFKNYVAREKLVKFRGASNVDNSLKVISTCKEGTVKSTNQIIFEKLKEHNLNLNEFKRLRMSRVSNMTELELNMMKDIREAIPHPTKQTVMSKIIPVENADNFLNGHWDPRARGYFSKLSDVKDVKNADDVINALRLDYEGTPYIDVNGNNVNDFVRIEFTTNQIDDIEIPYGKEMGGGYIDPYPATGNGFTSSPDFIVPEYVAKGNIPLNDGTKIYLNIDGEEVLVGKLEGSFKYMKGNYE